MSQPADHHPTPNESIVFDPVSLYDTPVDPPRRAAFVEPDFAAEPVVPEPPVAEVSPENAEHPEEPTAAPEHSDPVAPQPGEHAASEQTPGGQTGPDSQANPETGDDGPHIFNNQMEDVAATAGVFVRDAGDFAKSAWQRLGQFATSVLPDSPVDAPPPAPGEQPVRPTGNRGVERLVLRSVGRRVRLVGDPRVATIAVDGPHTLRRQGVVLEVNTEGELGLNFDQFSVIRPPRSLDDLRVLGMGKELVVRVNPNIPVDAEVTGSRLTTVGIPYLGKIRVSAGGANLSGVVEVRDALVQAGGATLSGPLSGGRSVVRVESGNLSVALTPEASVTVRAQTQLGKVSWPGDTSGDVDEYVIGSGSGRLELGVVLGRAVVRIEGQPR